MHSTDDAERKLLFHSHYLENIQSVLHFANNIYEITRKKVGLNFILFKNYTYDFKSLLEHIDADKIWIRLSPFNVAEDTYINFEGLIKTEDVLAKKAVSSQELIDVIQNLEESGISYSWAPAIDEEIKHNVACGQAMTAFLGTTY